jgi:hypothetical protein
LDWLEEVDMGGSTLPTLGFGLMGRYFYDQRQQKKKMREQERAAQAEQAQREQELKDQKSAEAEQQRTAARRAAALMRSSQVARPRSTVHTQPLGLSGHAGQGQGTLLGA